MRAANGVQNRHRLKLEKVAANDVLRRGQELRIPSSVQPECLNTTLCEEHGEAKRGNITNRRQSGPKQINGGKK